MLQRLATGSTGVEQARYRRSSTRGSEALARACTVYTQPVYRNFVYSVYIYHCVYGRSLALAVQCETTHGVYDFRRGFCTCEFDRRKFCCVSVCVINVLIV